MPYAGLMPSMEAIQQAVREPLSQAPLDQRSPAIRHLHLRKGEYRAPGNRAASQLPPAQKISPLAPRPDKSTGPSEVDVSAANQKC